MPPYPASDDRLLAMILAEVDHQLEGGAGARETAVWAAVHGWVCGHQEGDRCSQDHVRFDWVEDPPGPGLRLVPPYDED
jgi:hypothetical protein